jgi:hypothetical protein
MNTVHAKDTPIRGFPKMGERILIMTGVFQRIDQPDINNKNKKEDSDVHFR